MDNQERNREALVDHIADQDRILRRRNEQIARQAKQIENQLHNAREAQRAIEEQEARGNAIAVDLAAAVSRAEKAAMERDEYRAMHSERMKTIARLQENPRTLTADDRSRAYEAFHEVWGRTGTRTREAVNAALDAALTEPTRPEGAEELQALIRQAEAEGEGADDEALANYLAARLTDPTVKEQS